jgi:hypothetical protein
MTGREQDEYRALRATIRERGTARFWVFLAGVCAWAALTVATAALASTPLATMLPLIVLAASFEAVYTLHIGVERVGRYLQVFYEGNEEPRRWEHCAAGFGRPAGAVSPDALFIVPYLLAALFNIAPALVLSPTTAELVFIGGAHLLFALRLIVARHAASNQRATDLERFEQLKTKR